MELHEIATKNISIILQIIFLKIKQLCSIQRLGIFLITVYIYRLFCDVVYMNMYVNIVLICSTHLYVT